MLALPFGLTPTGKLAPARSRMAPRDRGLSPALDSLPTRLALN